MDPSANLDMFYPFLYNTQSTASIYFIQKIDFSGNVLWTKGWEAISTGGGSEIKEIKIMNNQFIYVTGWFQGELRVDFGPNEDTLSASSFVNSYLFKLDLNGNFITKTNFPSNSDVSVEAMEIDHENNIILSGSITGTPNMVLAPGAPSYITSVGFKDCFQPNMDSSLQLIWAHRFGGNGHEDILDIATDAAGNIITTGTYQSSSNDFNPGTGTASLPYISNYDGFVHKVDKNGNLKWVKACVSNGFTSVDRIDIGSNNEIYTIGSFTNDIAIDYPINSSFVNANSNFTESFVWALDFNGVSTWNKLINGSSSNEVTFVKVNGNEVSFGGWVFSNSTANLGSVATPYVLDTLTTDYIAHCDLNGNLNSNYERWLRYCFRLTILQQ
jgi:hypothetical protein